MKKLIVVMMALMSVNSFAGTVSGADATALRQSLINAGATAKIHMEASFLKVTDVKCSQNGGIVLLPFKCQFVEDGRLVEVAMGKKSEAIATGLTKAKAKTTSSREGERSETTITAKSVECTTMAMHHVIDCTVK